MKTYYDTLQVSKVASDSVIRAAYKTLCQKYHPDKYPDAVKAHTYMQRINTAYEVLSDPVRRAAYDKALADHEQSAFSSKQQANRSGSNFANPQSEVTSYEYVVPIRRFQTWGFVGFGLMMVWAGIAAWSSNATITQDGLMYYKDLIGQWTLRILGIPFGVAILLAFGSSLTSSSALTADDRGVRITSRGNRLWRWTEVTDIQLIQRDSKGKSCILRISRTNNGKSTFHDIPNWSMNADARKVAGHLNHLRNEALKHHKQSSG
ncbi:J domain-containing protein [Zoogloea sp.]|uniref:J domain-containing protein n=1 Tax=Zoogloea sp. TaxID=49181 RepID=UPI00261551FD|nr:J domain-containing protein [Zoogloea sp.]MDD3352256.1 J domain-containing protein [Zoogloea sp.]